MKIEIPDDILRAAGLSELDCLLQLAIHLYVDRKVSLAQALRLCSLSRAEFEKELARRDIAVYSLSDLHEDVDTLRNMGRL